MSTQKKTESTPRRLGRGLSSLLGAPVAIDASAMSPAVPVVAGPENPSTAKPIAGNTGFPESDSQRLSDVQSISVDRIEPSPFQPRRIFDQALLEGLAQSIRQSGVLQPVLVRPRAGATSDGGGGAMYELIAGERRWRAAKLAGLERIPAIIKTLDDAHAAELALIENVQREDLNAMDRAWALRALMDRFGLTQANLAERVGLERPTVANLLRLTELDAAIADLIAAGKLGAGHGKALLTAPAGEARNRLAQQAASEELSVREVERLAAAMSKKPEIPMERARANPGDDPRLAVLSDLQRQIGQQLGTKVVISTDRRGHKGRIIMEFYGLDHFDSLLSRLGVSTH